ncbi:MAG: CHAD domain-containing protein, partial [Rhodanobacteraceae bacterium]
VLVCSRSATGCEEGMPYHFIRDDRSVESGVRRIALEQIDKALGAIGACAARPDTAVHELRKSCKKVRGLLRLVRPAFERYKIENAAFRDTAGIVSALRDATVLAASYDAIVDGCQDRIDRQVIGSIRRHLTQQSRNSEVDVDFTRLLVECSGNLRDAADRVRDWRLDADGFAAMHGGFAKTYRRARKAMRKTREAPSPERFHEWRKRCKYHGYHARLLRPIWPGPMKAHAKCAYELGSLLGKYHDLAVLLERLTARPSDLSHIGGVEAIAGLVRSKQAILEKRAFPLGKRLLAASPSALASSWGARYAAWREELRPEIRNGGS